MLNAVNHADKKQQGAEVANKSDVPFHRTDPRRDHAAIYNEAAMK